MPLDDKPDLGLGLKWDRVPMKESEEESWKQLGFRQAR